MITIKHDLTFTIATGARRTSATWRNRETTWKAFLERLSVPARTGETAAEYRAMAKADKDNAKDVGGFVGGKLKGGRRLQQNVICRQLVCLDADQPKASFLADTDLALGGAAYAVYSTHSHRKGAPRLRLIVPLARPVPPDMYQAVARSIAYAVDIEAFDPTTYDVHRLMYWASVPSDDKDYVFDYCDGPAADPDAYLAEYEDWHDTAEWPVSSQEASARKTTIRRQGEPAEKPGLIGAFCRTYTISEAIAAFLPDDYVPTGHPDRYTYAHGSTTAGLVVYDDKFAYSHHGTDPTGGLLCNAFDLVRLHRFGHLDEDTDPRTPINKLPSYLAMTKLAGTDKGTVHELNATELAGLRTMFDDADLAPEDTDSGWLDQLERGSGRNAGLKPTAENFICILENDPMLKGRFGLDDFSHRILLKGDLPWRTKQNGRIWCDTDDASLRNYLSRYYKLTGKGVIDDALTEVMQVNRFHAVRDYLQGLDWDGTPRAAALYITYLGAEDSRYVRTVTTTHLKAAVARVMQPGVKFDPCLVLSGPQGIGKSTIFDKLGGPWFMDSIVTLQGKDPLEQLQGAWIIELSEMQAANKAENDQIKAFISRRVDKFRSPYGKRTEEYPRQCVFAATTNDLIFLKDRTGGRRFWPIFVSGQGPHTPADLTQADIDQIWAEVCQLWREDSSLMLPDDVLRQAKELQQGHTEGSEKVGLITDYLDKRLPVVWPSMNLFDRRRYLDEYEEDGPDAVQVRDKVCILEIWCEALGGNRNQLTSAIARELNAVMQYLPGWEPNKHPMRFGNLYGRQRAYRRTIGSIAETNKSQKSDG